MEYQDRKDGPLAEMLQLQQLVLIDHVELGNARRFHAKRGTVASFVGNQPALL